MTRNDGGHLEKCINSILCNTIYPYELIIVDNHSNDGLTGRLIRDLEKKYPTTIKAVENRANKWILGLNDALKSVSKDADQFFVLTDGDIAVKEPDRLSGECWLSASVRTMTENPWIGKLGLSIDLSHIKELPSMQAIFAGEEKFYRHSLNPDIYLAQVDTTIAIYRSDLFIHEEPKFYPGHNSYIKPHYHVGRLKKYQCVHLGWERYNEYPTQSQIDEKVVCFTKYCGYVNDITLKQASLSVRAFRKLSAIFRLYWGARLFLFWVIYLKKKKIIYLNELLQSGKSKY